MPSYVISPDALPESMTAALLLGHGGPEMLEVRDDVAVPHPGPDDVLVEVAACGMNNTDVNTRVGWYRKESGGLTWGGSGLSFPRIQGADVCGRIVAVGSGVDDGRVGQRVLVDPWIRDPDRPLDRDLAGDLGSERDGGFARFTAVPARNVYPVDSSYSDAELATFACSSSTAEHMLARSGLGAGETVVVTGASGGVGTALVQLARARGARVVAVAGESKLDAVAGLGADAVVARETTDLHAAVAEAAAGPVDVVADVVGGPDFPGWVDGLRRGGRYVTAGAIAGPIVELDLRTLYLSDLSLYGATVYPPELFADLVGYIEREEIRPVLAGTFPLTEIHAAQEAFAAKHHVGSFVLIP